MPFPDPHGVRPPSRRGLLGAGAAALLAPPALATEEPAPPTIDAFAAYPKVAASRDGGVATWWMSGLMFAHVDGLREFAVLRERSLLVCTAEPRAGGMTFTWRQIGYYEDLITSEMARTWANPFLGRTLPLQPAWSEGPKRYTLAPRPPAGATLTLEYDRARVIALGLTASAVEGRAVLAQTETKIQAFPGPDGRLPAPSTPGATGLQTVFSFVADQAAVQDPATATVPATGFYNLVWDSLPAWMGFGDRYGSALSKGLMCKTRPGERPDPTAWRRLRELHPYAFKGERLRTDWS